ncbi:MAG: LysR family transcriptional regulator [Polyangiaceae bacterium]|jgi:DNA-binding transcriptional LysR family regulator
MFEWDDARHFLAVHRKGSLSAAAKQLGVNQSTVGRRLATLEEHLGAKLFFRTRDGYRIAPAGERLLPHAERMEDEATSISREIAGEETALTGTVCVTAGDLFGPVIIAPLLVDLHARYPDIDLELDTDNRLRSLTKREADIAVRIGNVAESGVAARKVCEFGSAVYASKGYLAAHGRPRDGDWSGHHFIGFSETREIMEARWIEEHAAKGRVVFRGKGSLPQLVMAKAGLGIAALPCYAGDAEADLVRLIPVSQIMKASVWLVVHEDMRHAGRIRACIELLADGLRAQSRLIRGH